MFISARWLTFCVLGVFGARVQSQEAPHRVTQAGKLRFLDPIARWEERQPDVVLGRESLVGASPLYSGEADLSAHAWFAFDQKRFYTLVAVRDDQEVMAPDVSQLSRFDSLDFSLYSRNRYGFVGAFLGRVNGQQQATFALVGGGVFFMPQVQLRTQRDNARGMTIYRLSLPLDAVFNAKSKRHDFAYRLRINDRDVGRQQALDSVPLWNNELLPTLWPRLEVPAPWSQNWCLALKSTPDDF